VHRQPRARETRTISIPQFGNERMGGLKNGVAVGVRM
jgi:hypothetical protein